MCLISIQCFAIDFKISSPSFMHNADIPRDYTCQGADIAPALVWENVPPGTMSYALIMDDIDAPNGTWTHWLIFNIPVAITKLNTGTGIPPGAISGKNDWGTTGYRGPCPPNGTHRYYFKIYALDNMLALTPSSNKVQLENAMKNHVLASAQLMGLYKKH